jgi:hypothetical protein
VDTMIERRTRRWPLRRAVVVLAALCGLVPVGCGAEIVVGTGTLEVEIDPEGRRAIGGTEWEVTITGPTLVERTLVIDPTVVLTVELPPGLYGLEFLATSYSDAISCKRGEGRVDGVRERCERTVMGQARCALTVAVLPNAHSAVTVRTDRPGRCDAAA